MQLEILQRIEREISLVDIPIDKYFDLIVGTSGGGLVAAGIGLKRLSVGRCIQMFEEFASKSFVPRPLVSWPILGKLVLAHHHGRYKTSSLQNVLKNAFGDESIFGAALDSNLCTTVPGLKVALTATSSNRKPCLLTNYNRPPPERKPQGMWKREEKQTKTQTEEIKVQDSTPSSSMSSRDGADDPLRCPGSVVYEFRNKTRRYPIQEPLDADSEVATHPEREKERSTGSLASSDNEDDETGNPLLHVGDDEIYGNRADDPTYDFFRGEDESTELRLWEAVRATSAAPGCFKSFSHAASRYTFDDGALRCNNPASLADKERKVLWPELSKQDPDIMLSLGTGFDPDPPQVADDSPRPETGITSFLHKMKDLGYTAVLEDMDSEMKWREFTDGLRMDDQDKERLSKYRRLNPYIMSPIPKMDDFCQVDSLRRKVRRWLDRRPAATDVTTIAHKLIASLFYFEFLGASVEPCIGVESLRRGVTLTCTGRVKCRVRSEALLERIELYANRPHSSTSSIFLIGDRNEVKRVLTAEPTPEAGPNSTYRISYDVRFSLRHADKDTEMCIYLSLWDDPGKAVSISGFPRCLYPEANSLSKRTLPRNGSFRYIPDSLT